MPRTLAGALALAEQVDTGSPGGALVAVDGAGGAAHGIPDERAGGVGAGRGRSLAGAGTLTRQATALVLRHTGVAVGLAVGAAGGGIDRGTRRDRVGRGVRGPGRRAGRRARPGVQHLQEDGALVQGGQLSGNVMDAGCDGQNGESEGRGAELGVGRDGAWANEIPLQG